MWDEHDGARVGAADHQFGRPDAQVQRTTERRAAQHRDPLARDEPERGHPLGGHARGVDGGDGAGVIGCEVVEREVHRSANRLLMILIIYDVGAAGKPPMGWN